MLLDPETFALAPGVERLLPREGLKTELFSCLVETNTPICETAFEAGDELRRLRRLVVELAESEGLAVAAAGSHPFSIPEEQQIVREPRYRKMVDELGATAKGQLVCGLHVHVGMESFETCLRTLEGLRPWLQAVLEVSANSPYLAGEESGVLSSRLVGRTTPSAARDARGADRRPGDVGRPRGSARRSGAGALCGATAAGGRHPRRRRAGGA